MGWKLKCYEPENMKYRYLVFLQVMGYMNNGFDNSATNMALPEIQREMDIDLSLSQWLITISTIAKTAFSIPLAQLGARIGVVNSLIFFTGVMAVLFPTLIFIKNFWLFVAVRLVIGLAQSGAQVNNSSLQQKLAREADRKRYAEHQQLTMNVARVFGPFISTVIIQFLNWKYVYVVCAVAALTRCINISFIRNVEMKRKEFDIFGAVLLIVCLSSFCVALTCIGQKYFIVAGALFAVTIAAAVWFVLFERKAKNPIVDVTVISPKVRDLLVIQSGMWLANSGESLVIPQYFDYYHYQKIFVGAVNSTRVVLGLIGVVVSQKLGKKFTIQQLLMTGFITVFVFSCFETGFLAYMWPFTIFFLVKGFFNALGIQSLNPAILTSVSADIIHKINGLSVTVNNLGQCLAQSLVGMIIDVFKKVNPDLYVSGLYASMGLVTIMLEVNVLQIIYRFYCAQKDKPSDTADEKQNLLDKKPDVEQMAQ